MGPGYPLLLFDLAVLYRALAFGTDGDLDPAETAAMRDLLQAWAPDQDPSYVDHVLCEAILANVGALTIGEVVGRISRGLDGPARARVLLDLRQIAAADGRITLGEQDLLAFVEMTLGE